MFLYNFFGSSPSKNQWRVIFKYMIEKDLLDSTSLMSFPSFIWGKHNMLCSELKHLYVAITRTRQKLWIFENVEELSEPMFVYWKKLGFVQVREFNESLAQEMQIASSQEEWKSRGIKVDLVFNIVFIIITYVLFGLTSLYMELKYLMMFFN